MTSTITAIASESGAQLSIVMCQIQHWLRQARGLNDTADLDGSFFFDELTDSVEEIG